MGGLVRRPPPARRRAPSRGDRLRRSLDLKEARSGRGLSARPSSACPPQQRSASRGGRASRPPAPRRRPPRGTQAHRSPRRHAPPRRPQPSPPADVVRQHGVRVLSERDRELLRFVAEQYLVTLPQLAYLANRCPRTARWLRTRWQRGRPRRRRPAPRRRADRPLAHPARPRRTRAPLEVGAAQLRERADERRRWSSCASPRGTLPEGDLALPSDARPRRGRPVAAPRRGPHHRDTRRSRSSSRRAARPPRARAPGHPAHRKLRAHPARAATGRQAHPGVVPGVRRAGHRDRLRRDPRVVTLPQLPLLPALEHRSAVFCGGVRRRRRCGPGGASPTSTHTASGKKLPPALASPLVGGGNPGGNAAPSARARAPAQPCGFGGRSRFLRLRLRIPDHLPSACGESKGRWSGTTGASAIEVRAGARARGRAKEVEGRSRAEKRVAWSGADAAVREGAVEAAR